MRKRGKLMAAMWAVASLWAVMAVAGERGAALNRSAVSSHVEYLASDALGGRGVGEKGIDLAADYIAAHFASCGLRPGGDEGSFFQAFDISSRKQDPALSRLAVTGAEIPVTAQQDFATVASSGSGSFEGRVVFVGYGIRNAEKGHDDYAAVDVSGAVVLVLSNEPEQLAEQGERRRPGRGRLLAKGRVAKERGAVGVLFVDPPGGEKDELNAARRMADEDAGLPMMQITRQLADRLLKAAGQDSLESIYDRMNRDQKPVGMVLGQLKVTGDPGVTTTVQKAKNVIGILPGEGPLAGEYIVIGGHYDHLGTTAPRRPGRRAEEAAEPAAQIHNGADDNASGTAAVMELARIYAAGPRPARTMVFMAFSGEEIGLLGSEHFTAHPTIPLKDTVTMINLDMVGRLGKRAVMVYGSDSAKEFGGMLDKHAAAAGVEIQKAGMIQNSDHASFYRKQIPVLFPFAGLHEDYHQPSDDVEKLDYDGAMGIMQLVVAVTDDLIASPSRPTYQQSAAISSGLKVRMGIVPSTVEGPDSAPGWPIAGVMEDGPAEQAGMKEGDRILTINSQPLKSFDDYMKIMAPFKPGDEVELRVRRGEQESTLKVKLIGRE